MSLLDDIAQIIGEQIPAAGLTRDAVLIKATEGATAPGEASGAPTRNTTSFAAQGLEISLKSLKLAGTLIDGVDIAIGLLGATIAGGAIPAPGDRITIQGVTYTIVDKGVGRDPAGAVFSCQCRR